MVVVGGAVGPAIEPALSSLRAYFARRVGRHATAPDIGDLVAKHARRLDE